MNVYIHSVRSTVCKVEIEKILLGGSFEVM
jgi:hypothetical protein